MKNIFEGELSAVYLKIVMFMCAAGMLIAAIILGSNTAHAATLQVYPVITSDHGGQANSTDLYSCVSDPSGLQDCEPGVPTFQLPDGGPYTISVSAPAGYSYSLAGDCAGTLSADEDAICHVFYHDGAKQAPAPRTPSPAVSTPVPAAPVTTGGTTAAGAVLPTKSGLTLDQIGAIIGLLRAFGVDEATVVNVENLL